MRPLAWRVGRFLYRWGRREGDNHPRTNGEYWLLEQMVSRSQGARARTRVLGDFFSLVAPEVWGELRSGKYDAMRLALRAV